MSKTFLEVDVPETVRKQIEEAVAKFPKPKKFGHKQEYYKQYYKDHKEKMKAYQINYYYHHRERLQIYQQEYQAQRREKKVLPDGV